VLTTDQVRQAAAALLAQSDLPERWSGPILSQDFGFSFSADLWFWETNESASVANAARAALRSALARRDKPAVADLAYILKLPAPNLVEIGLEAGAQTAEDVADGLQETGDVILGTLKNAGSSLTTVGTVLPWALAAVLVFKVLR